MALCREWAESNTIKSRVFNKRNRHNPNSPHQVDPRAPASPDADSEGRQFAPGDRVGV